MGVHLLLERRIGLGLGVGALEGEDQRHQGLGDEAAAIDAEMPALVGAGAEGIGLLHAHTMDSFDRSRGASASRAARMKARILPGSLIPGARSTPEETSTPRAPVMAMASVTLPASRPPDSIHGTPGSTPRNRVQSNLLPRPPGRVASAGGRASNRSRSATLA